jgi:hypothetical protein
LNGSLRRSKVVEMSSPRSSYQLLPAIVLVAAAWLLLAWPWLSGTVTVPWDSKAHFQPQLAFLAQSLAAGESPFWAPQVFAGHPQIADPQSLIFSPPFLLLALLNPSPGLVAMDAAVYGALLAGAIFILLYFRDRGWHEAGAILAALSFAFGGAAAWRIQHVGQVVSLAYLPIAIWLLDRAIRRGGWGYGLAAGIISGFMLLGRDQVAFLGLLVLAAYVVFLLWRLRWPLRRSVLPLAAGAIGGFVTVVVPMVMTLLLAADSNRPMITLTEAGKGSLHPWSLLTAVIPHLYGISRPLSDYWGPPSPDWGPVDLYLARNMATFYFGILPVLTLMLLPILSRFRQRLRTAAIPPVEPGADRAEAIFFFGAAILLFLYSLGRYTPFFGIIFSAVPGIDRFRRPADALFVACAMASMAAGYGLHRWIAIPRFRLPRWLQLTGLALVVACLASGIMLASVVGRLNQTVAPLAASLCFLVAGCLALVILRRLHDRRIAAMIVVTVMLTADLGWNNAPNESTGLSSDTYDILRPDTQNETIRLLQQKVRETAAPDRIDRVELAGLSFHAPNAGLIHNLHHTLGYNPLRSAAYSASVGARDHIAGPDQRLFTPLNPSYRSLMTDMVGLRFIATGIPLAELYAAVPRVLFASAALQADFDSLIKSGDWPAGFDPRETVLLDRLILPRETEARSGPRSVRILRYRNTEVVIEADSQHGGFVVLNDSYDDWWHVEVDGQRAQLERANVTFRAVKVPPGKVTVRFVFRPFRGALAELLRRR